MIDNIFKYSPDDLIDCIGTISKGYLIVDKELVKALKPEWNFEGSFIKTLWKDYKWDFTRFQNVTIYFYLRGDKVFGGVYDLESETNVTKRLIFDRSLDECLLRYIYTQDGVNSFFKKIISILGDSNEIAS